METVKLLGAAASPTKKKAPEERMKPRQHTDVTFLLVFFVALGGFAYVIQYAMANYSQETWDQVYRTGMDTAVGGYSDKLTEFSTVAINISGCRMLLAYGAVVAVLLGFAFLYFLRLFAEPLIYVAILIILAIPTWAGVYFVMAAQSPGAAITGNEQYDLAVGVGCLALALIIGCCACCHRRGIKVAAGCIEVGTEAVFSMPSVLSVPCVQLVTVLGSTACMLGGFAALLSCGKAEFFQRTSVEIAAGHNNAMLGQVFTTEQQIYILYYALMMFWVAELFAAIAQFVLAYVVILWYFTPYENGKKAVACTPVLHGYIACLRYHLGTIALGAFLLATMRLVKLILDLLAKLQEETGNPLVACVVKIVSCFLACWVQCVQFLNKNAYMDVALNSNSYCVAAKEALQVIARNAGPMAMLNGAMGLIVLLGVGAISGLTGLFGLYMFDQGGWPGTREGAGIGAAVVGAIVGFVFMNVMDMTCDTIIFCYAVDEKDGVTQKFDASSASPSRSFLACCSSAKHSIEDAAHKIKGDAKDEGHTPKELAKLLAQK